MIFASGTQSHEVLPCEEGDRLALTLWVEHAPSGGAAAVIPSHD